MQMIKSILLVDDECLFHLVFEDACNILNISLNLESVSSADKAEELFVRYAENPASKPQCIFVDLNIIGSYFNGIELVRRINYKHGNCVVIGIISSSSDKIEIEKAKQAGAMFWIVKSDDIEPRLEQFRKDYSGYESGTKSFKVYK